MGLEKATMERELKALRGQTAKHKQVPVQHTAATCLTSTLCRA